MKHEGTIEEDFSGTCNQAVCTCGYCGPLRDNPKEATADLQRHYAMFAERISE